MNPSGPWQVRSPNNHKVNTLSAPNYLPHGDPRQLLTHLQFPHKSPASGDPTGWGVQPHPQTAGVWQAPRTRQARRASRAASGEPVWTTGKTAIQISEATSSLKSPNRGHTEASWGMDVPRESKEESSRRVPLKILRLPLTPSEMKTQVALKASPKTNPQVPLTLTPSTQPTCAPSTEIAPI